MFYQPNNGAMLLDDGSPYLSRDEITEPPSDPFRDQVQGFERQIASRQQMLQHPLSPEGSALKRKFAKDLDAIRNMQANGFPVRHVADYMGQVLDHFDSRWSPGYVQKEPTFDEVAAQNTGIIPVTGTPGHISYRSGRPQINEFDSQIAAARAGEGNGNGEAQGPAGANRFEMLGAAMVGGGPSGEAVAPATPATEPGAAAPQGSIPDWDGSINNWAVLPFGARYRDPTGAIRLKNREDWHRVLVDNEYQKLGTYDRVVAAGVLPKWDRQKNRSEIDWTAVYKAEGDVRKKQEEAARRETLVSDQEAKNLRLEGTWIRDRKGELKQIAKPGEETPEARRKAALRQEKLRLEVRAGTAEGQMQRAAAVSEHVLRQLDAWAREEDADEPDKDLWNRDRGEFKTRMKRWNEFLARPNMRRYAEAAVKARFGMPINEEIPQAQRATPEQILIAADMMRRYGKWDMPASYREYFERAVAGYNPETSPAGTAPAATPPVSPPPLPLPSAASSPVTPPPSPAGQAPTPSPQPTAPQVAQPLPAGLPAESKWLDANTIQLPDGRVIRRKGV